MLGTKVLCFTRKKEKSKKKENVIHDTQDNDSSCISNNLFYQKVCFLVAVRTEITNTKSDHKLNFAVPASNRVHRIPPSAPLFFFQKGK